MKRLMMIVVMVSLLLVLAAPTMAHEHQQVGPYEINFGWRVEPAYAGLFNGPELTITLVGESEEHGEEAAEEGEAGDHGEEAASGGHHEAGEMVTGAEETLQLEVIFGDQSKVLTLRAVRNEPGHYIADLIPTRPGDYQFRVTGTIGETEVDILFDSSDGGYSTVEPIEDIQFP